MAEAPFSTMKGRHMREIEFHGVKVAYDETCTASWKWQKDAASGDMGRTLKAIERLLCGKDEEYADALGDSAAEMQDLIVAVLEDFQSAKN